MLSTNEEIPILLDGRVRARSTVSPRSAAREDGSKHFPVEFRNISVDRKIFLTIVASIKGYLFMVRALSSYEQLSK
jgi:hypothetical protein